MPSFYDELTAMQLDYRKRVEHLISDQPRVYADFNKTVGLHTLALTTLGTIEDLKMHGIQLVPGLLVHFWTDDGSDTGEDDPLIFEGIVRFDSARNRWIAEIDWDSITPASKRQNP